jgi:predicted transposase YdaD
VGWGALPAKFIAVTSVIFTFTARAESTNDIKILFVLKKTRYTEKVLQAVCQRGRGRGRGRGQGRGRGRWGVGVGVNGEAKEKHQQLVQRNA